MTIEEALNEIVTHYYGEEIEIAIDVFEKQIPQKPNKNGLYFYCPCHAESVVVGHIKKDRTITISNYCPHCGQKLDWSDDKKCL